VAIINETLAAVAFPRADAVGSQLGIEIEPDLPCRGR